MKNQIIPSINCEDFSCIKKRLSMASGFMTDVNEKWVHIDVSDGKFTPHVSWNNPEELKNIINLKSDEKTEVHLMIENPDSQIDTWLRAGANRIIVHLEAMQDSVLILEKCRAYRQAGKDNSVECFLAIKPGTEVEQLLTYLSDPRTKSPSRQLSDASDLKTDDSMDTNIALGGALVRGSAPREEESLTSGSEALHFDGFLILGVVPGPSGQEMKADTLEKIKIFRKNKPDAIIEVDGGVNLETVKLAKVAGANLFVVGAYIFENENPERAYKDLRQAVL